MGKGINLPLVFRGTAFAMSVKGFTAAGGMSTTTRKASHLQVSERGLDLLF